MLSPGAGNPGPGEAGELNRDALVPSSPPSLGCLHTLRPTLCARRNRNPLVAAIRLSVWKNGIQ